MSNLYHDVTVVAAAVVEGIILLIYSFIDVYVELILVFVACLLFVSPSLSLARYLLASSSTWFLLGALDLSLSPPQNLSPSTSHARGLLPTYYF